MSEVVIRSANRDDLANIIGFIKLLAENEGRLDAVTISEAQLEGLLFGDRAIGAGFVGELDGKTVISALVMQKYSSYRGTRILYIEDLIVSEDVRGLGMGAKMMAHLAQAALEWGCDAMEWYALKSDAAAIRFYERLGADIDLPHAILGFDHATLKKVAGQINE